MAEKELELKLPKIHKDDLDESYRDDKKKFNMIYLSDHPHR